LNRIDATRAALPSLCRHCGGETHGRIALSPSGGLRSARTCSSCGDVVAWEGAVSFEARAIIERELPTVRRRRRARTLRAQPIVLLWIPPADVAHESYLDAAVMLKARLASDDPSVSLETSTYPKNPDTPSAAQAALADLSILLAPGARACARALELLGNAIPPSRALVIATDLTVEERKLLAHRRLIAFTRDQVASGDLFDAVAGTIATLRQVAHWRAVTPLAAVGEPLGVYATYESAIRATIDELPAFLLRLADEPAPIPVERFLKSAGGDRDELRSCLDSLRRAGALEVVGDRVTITSKGRDQLRRLWPAARSQIETATDDASTDTAELAASEEDTPLGRLFRNAREGNQDALARLLKTGGETARRVARKRLGPALRSKVDSIDISQSVFADLMNRMDTFEFRGEQAWRGYLRQLVENKIRAKADYFGAARRDMRRERAIGTPRGDYDAPGILELSSGGPSPTEILLREEQIDNVEEALALLPEAERDVLIFRVFEGLSHREIADRMGRPTENSVHKLYGRALARLAGIMGRKQ